MSEYWPGNDALALFERNAELGWRTDGSNVQDIATALTVDQAQGNVVRYGSVLHGGATGEDALTKV